MPAPAAPRRRLDTLHKPSIGQPKNKPVQRPVIAKCCDAPKIEDSEGQKVCTNCYTLISESNIVADVTFSEDSRGAATVQGGFIGENARHARTMGASAFRRVGGGERNTFAEIENNGRRVLNQLCPSLNVSDMVQSQAASIWSLAAKNGFNAGRKTEEIVAACLYAACRRRRGNDTMLIDISEKIHTNVFRLGRVYRDLISALFLPDEKIQMAGHQYPVEIEPLIEKYCRKLEFGEYTRQVAEDAIKIIRRMSRDWMTQGRHPAGLCGACIILAARMNNFRRSIREVVWVAKIADATVAKRIQEFRATKAAGLTVEQFRKIGPRIRDQADPPSFLEGEVRKQKFEEKKRKRQESRSVSVSQTPAVDEEAHTESNKRRRLSMDGVDAAEDEQGGEPGRATTKRRRADEDVIEISDGEESDSSTDTSSMAGLSTPVLPTGPNKKNQKRTFAAVSDLQEPRFDEDGFAIPAIPSSLLHGTNAASPSKKRGRKKKEAPPPPRTYTEEELLSEEQLEREIEETFENNELVKNISEEIDSKSIEQRALETAIRQKQYDAQERSARRIEDQHTWYDASHPNHAREEVTAEELATEFEDDAEVNNCVLTDDEAKRKEQIWLTYNEDWLRSQHEKELMKKLDEARGGKAKKSAAAGKKKRKRSRMGDGSLLEEAQTPVESPADAAVLMLEKHADQNFSKFIDYDNIRRIYGAHKRSNSSASQSRGASLAPSGSEAWSESGTPAPRTAAQEKEGAHAGAGAGAQEEDEDDGDAAPASPANEWAEPEEEQGDATAGAEDEEDDYNEALDDVDGHFGEGDYDDYEYDEEVE